MGEVSHFGSLGQPAHVNRTRPISERDVAFTPEVTGGVVVAGGDGVVSSGRAKQQH